MPAIHPARLKQQAAVLADQFDQPSVFVRSLHHLLDSYAERVSQAGQSGEPRPLLTSYRVRPPVLRRILLELAPRAQQDQEAALVLCDALWEQPYLEFRMLAITLLGKSPCQPVEPILERVHAWVKPDLEIRLLDAVLDQGLACVRQNCPDAMVAQLEDWLASPDDKFHQRIGLRALQFMASQPDFDNLPVLFRLIQPMVRVASSDLRPDILDILAALAHRSPRETAFFLKQTLGLPNSSDTAWLIRQSLHEFPAALQDDLRRAGRGD